LSISNECFDLLNYILFKSLLDLHIEHLLSFKYYVYFLLKLDENNNGECIFFPISLFSYILIFILSYYVKFNIL
jgi:hypothetical protein